MIRLSALGAVSGNIRPKSGVSLSALVQFGSFDDGRQSRVIGIDSMNGESLSWSRVLDGNMLSQVGSLPQGQLELEYDKPYVIGRAQGTPVPYLAPHLQVTRQVPGSVKEIPTDRYISRAHFQLIARKEGLELVNGVPTPMGGVRAPQNGTFLLEPEDRRMADGESYVIVPGQRAKIRIGANTVLLLSAPEDAQA